MKLRFTNSITRAFLSFCILSIGAIGGLYAQNNAYNSGQNSNLSTGQLTQSSSVVVNKQVSDKNSLIGGKLLSARHIPTDSMKAIKYVTEAGVALDMNPSNLDPQSLQFNINQGDLGDLYKLLALYKSEAGKGHTVVNLTRKSQLGKAADSFPVFRKYVVDDNLAGYTPAVASVEPPIIDINLKGDNQSVNSVVSGSTLTETAAIMKENFNLSDLISLYPNPAQNYITVDLSSISGTQIIIYSLQGKLVKTIESSQNLPQQKIDIADLPSGFYMMSINSPSGQVVKKFSKIN